VTLPRWLVSRKNPSRLAPRIGAALFLFAGLWFACTGASGALVWFVTACAAGFAIEHGEESHLPLEKREENP
jgi:hypothetical protein